MFTQEREEEEMRRRERGCRKGGSMVTANSFWRAVGGKRKKGMGEGGGQGETAEGSEDWYCTRIVCTADRMRMVVGVGVGVGVGVEVEVEVGMEGWGWRKRMKRRSWKSMRIMGRARRRKREGTR
jgi:hypothetical protein